MISYLTSLILMLCGFQWILQVQFLVKGPF
jgi:hypothetical protein